MVTGGWSDDDTDVEDAERLKALGLEKASRKRLNTDVDLAKSGLYGIGREGIASRSGISLRQV